MEKEFLSRREGAAYIRARGLPCAPSTLAKLATIGGGPKFQKFGRNVIYTTAELDNWVEARLSKLRSSTADRVF